MESSTFFSETSFPVPFDDRGSTTNQTSLVSAAESLSSPTTTSPLGLLAAGTGVDSVYENGNGSADVEVSAATRDLFLANIEITILSLMFVVAVVGNSLTLMALCLRRRKLTRMHYFILHLCVSDLLVAFGHIFPQIIFDTYGTFPGGYTGDDALCRLVKYLQLLGPYLSSYVLVATAVDRYQAICFPLMNCSWTPRRSQLMVGLAWSCACICSVPQLFIFRYTVATPYSHMECWAVFAQPWGEVVYVLWSAIAMFVLPLLALVFTYAGISRAIWINFREKNRNSEHPSTLLHLSSAAGRHRQQQQQRNGDTDAKSGPVKANRGGGGGGTAATSGGRWRRRRKASNGQAASSTVVLCTNGVSSAAGTRVAARGFGDRKSQCAHSTVAPPSGGQPRTHSVSGISRAKMKTIKLTLVVVMCYISCSLPYFSAMVYITWNPGVQESAVGNRYVFTILALLASLNSCVNPWLYLVFNENLANTVREMLSCRALIKQKRPSSFVGATGAFSRSSLSESRSCTSRVQLHVVSAANVAVVDRSAANGRAHSLLASLGDGSTSELRRGSTASRTTCSNSDEFTSKRTSPDSGNGRDSANQNTLALDHLKTNSPTLHENNFSSSSNSVQDDKFEPPSVVATATSLL